MANRPFPKLAYMFFGPYKVLEKIGAVAYRLQLPEDSAIHPLLHISQLKVFHQDYTPLYSKLPTVSDLEASATVPEQILWLVKKGNHAIPQGLLTWTGLPKDSATWEGCHVVKQHFPSAPAWGQASSSASSKSNGKAAGIKKGGFTVVTCIFCSRHLLTLVC